MDKKIHIVCHDIPYPVTHGGYFDLFHKIRLLHQQGISITLHCFYKDRQPASELNAYCENVYYYKRNFALPFFIPYIVGSRSSTLLLKRLNADSFPVLLEGVHATYWLYKNKLKARNILVRLHNTEHIYYDHLAQFEPGFFKRLYFKIESHLLKKYEHNIANRAMLIAVSKKDQAYFKTRLKAEQVEFLPVLLPFQKCESLDGIGNYCLYHGNLSVNENVVAIKALIENYFSHFNTPLVVAGFAPDKKLKEWIAGYPNIRLIDSPNDDEMEELIRNAQINMLPSANATGVKLKILHALFVGRHCITNHQAVEGMPEASLCHLYDDPQEMATKIQELLFNPLSEAEKLHREKVLTEFYNSEKNVKQLSAWLFRHYPKPSHLPS